MKGELEETAVRMSVKTHRNGKKRIAKGNCWSYCCGSVTWDTYALTALVSMSSWSKLKPHIEDTHKKGFSFHNDLMDNQIFQCQSHYNQDIVAAWKTGELLVSHLNKEWLVRLKTHTANFFNAPELCFVQIYHLTPLSFLKQQQIKNIQTQRSRVPSTMTSLHRDCHNIHLPLLSSVKN